MNNHLQGTGSRDVWILAIGRSNGAIPSNKMAVMASAIRDIP